MINCIHYTERGGSGPVRFHSIGAFENLRDSILFARMNHFQCIKD